MTNTTQELRTFLLADAGVTALVVDRVYSDVLTQGATLPAIVLTLVGGVSIYSTTGLSGLASPKVQVDVYAANPAGRHALADLVRLRLAGYSGPIGAGVAQGIFLDSTRDLYEDAPKSYRRSFDFTVWNEESAT